MRLSSRRPSGLLVVMSVLAATPAFLHAQQKIVGWRTDGTGSYPKADPPLHWSTTKNVRWRTPMPGYGVSHPVPLGERIFVCSEPCILLCLHRDDGRVLWQKGNRYSELEIDPDTRQRLEVEQAQTAELAKKESAVRKEMDALSRTLKKDQEPKEQIEKKLQPFRKQIDALKAEAKKLPLAVRYSEPHPHSYAGYSAPTPVTNGKEVFVAFGNGLVACFDLEGQRKWLKLIEHSNAPFAHSGSPVLAGDKLLIHFTDLVALDTATGAEAWRFKHPTSHGTPLVTRIGDVDVVFTPRGAMLRAQDGKLLADKLGSCGANSPVLDGRTVYFVHNAVTAVQLPDALLEPMKVPVLWRSKVKGGGYGFSSPVVYDGLLYAASDQGVLSVLDAQNGKPAYEERLNVGGAVYPSLSQAGNRIYVSSDTGETVVLQPGREYQELARNRLETFRSSLVFEGKRMYVRTAKNVFCIEE